MGLWSLLKRIAGRPDRVHAVRLLADGVRRARDGEIEAALGFYRRAVRADEGYALAHLNVALALQDLYARDQATLTAEQCAQRLTEIAPELDQALELDPTLTAAWLARGYVLRALGRDQGAVSDLEKYLELASPKDARREQVERDRADLQRRIQLGEQRREAIAAVSAELPRDATGDQEIAQQLALEQALERLTEAIAREPDDAELWWATGVARRRLDEPEAARAAFERCLEIDPDFAAAVRELSTLAYRDQQYDRALELARRAHQLQPTNAAVICNLGVCHMELGHYSEAREYIELAAKLDPDDPIIRECLAELAKVSATEEPA
ncbi:MAG: tetratricopeptide repeat protein [Deltaproteobacteria bacterium]|nr:tetratricopeptide repeat protein [Deltaproteobacteria bacterium]